MTSQLMNISWQKDGSSIYPMTKEIVMELEEKRSSYPRVSDIIGRQTEAEMRLIPIDNLTKAALRGTAVHNYCIGYLKGLWLPEIEEDYLPYFEAFKVWADQNVASLLHSGIRLYDDQMEFSGEFDLIVRLKDGRTGLIDIKTSSSVSTSWPVQLAAYQHLLKNNNYTFDYVFNLHIRKRTYKEKTTYKTVIIDDYDLTKSWEIFLNAYNCYNYFHRKLKCENTQKKTS